MISENGTSVNVPLVPTIVVYRYIANCHKLSHLEQHTVNITSLPWMKNLVMGQLDPLPRLTKSIVKV